MPVIANTAEELKENKEFQSALRLVLPRLHGYLEANVLLKVARDGNRSAEEKGMFLEAYNDLLHEIDSLYTGVDIQKAEPTQRMHPRLHNVHHKP